MTDSELLSRVLGMFDPGAAALRGLRRGGRLLLGLPPDREAARRVLRLYQPQRGLARLAVALLRSAVAVGQHRMILSALRLTAEPVAVTPAVDGIEPGTCGVMLGSPEHPVRRAIASYRHAGTWEVAKISFGKEGAGVLQQEARALRELQPLAAGVPCLLGLHQAGDATMLRMPYLTGRRIGPGESAAALRLLDRWITGLPLQAITAYPEWAAIELALSLGDAGRKALERLSRETLRPVVCHGDFARWNLLRRDDGSLLALDWEWGHNNGLAGIDLVHFFLQDARLVKRLGCRRALGVTRAALATPGCRQYLHKTGWSGDPLLPIVACLAYKQGAGHQDNTEVLDAAVALMVR